MKKTMICLLMLLLSTGAWADESTIGGYESPQVNTLEFIGLVSAPALSGTGMAKLYHNRTDNKLYLSKNGAAFVEVGAGGAGTLAETLALGADANDVSITSLAELQFLDADLYIDGSVDGIIKINANALKLNPDADGDITLFEDVDVADDANGKSFIMHRKAAEGDQTLEFLITSYAEAYLYSSNTLYFTSGSTMYFQQGWGDINLAYNANGDVTLFYDWGLDSGRNRNFSQFGYITADTADKYINWRLNDDTDYFELTREDAFILGFDVQMPLTEDGDAVYSSGEIPGFMSITFDGGGSAIVANSKWYGVIPYGCTLKSYYIVLDQSGSIQFDIWVDTFGTIPDNGDTITNGHEPTVAGATSASDTDISDWGDVTMTATNQIVINVDSIATAQKATLVILYDQD